MVKTFNNQVLKNKFVKAFLILDFILFILLILNPIRKLLIYKSIDVFEDQPLGSFVHDYNNGDNFTITTLQPEDIVAENFSYNKVSYRKYGNIVRWSLKADEYFKGHTDVIGICRYHFYVYPTNKVKSSIEIDHQGGACNFWENIKQGDTIDVIGEVTTSKPNWTETGKLEKYATEYVMEVRPMIIKHSNKIYLDTSLPTPVRLKLLESI